MTPVLHASRWGHEGVVRLLEREGIDLDVRDKNGQTPLMHASCRGHERIVVFLSGKGVDVNAMDKDGRNAFILAFINGAISVAEYLAPLVIPDGNVPYPLISLSSIMPRCCECSSTHAQVSILRSVIPLMLDRAVTDSNFGIAMERDIERILSTPSTENRHPLLDYEIELLTKLQKALRSVDYTERHARSSQNKGNRTHPVIDMEL